MPATTPSLLPKCTPSPANPRHRQRSYVCVHAFQPRTGCQGGAFENDRHTHHDCSIRWSTLVGCPDSWGKLVGKGCVRRRLTQIPAIIFHARTDERTWTFTHDTNLISSSPSHPLSYRDNRAVMNLDRLWEGFHDGFAIHWVRVVPFACNLAECCVMHLGVSNHIMVCGVGARLFLFVCLRGWWFVTANVRSIRSSPSLPPSRSRRVGGREGGREGGRPASKKR